jgi:hypothetical protein
MKLHSAAQFKSHHVNIVLTQQMSQNEQIHHLPRGTALNLGPYT